MEKADARRRKTEKVRECVQHAMFLEDEKKTLNN